jgi:NADPH:quinone reductase-like Zn-dependent oxidoreductase
MLTSIGVAIELPRKSLGAPPTMVSASDVHHVGEQEAEMRPIPKNMRAAVIEKFGGPSVFKVKEVPVPEVDASDVLIALHTAGVGSWDPDMRTGWSPSGHTRFPLVLGSDGAGVVAAVGARVRKLKVGDRVYANTFDNPKGGSYALYVAVPVENVAMIPEELDMKQAGALPISGLTALQGLDGALHLRKGESIIIQGASGAVGTVAVQLAKARGARVLAVASGKDGAALARRLGADLAVDGKTDDVAGAARRFAPDGVDALLALASGKASAACLEALGKASRVAYPHGVEPAPKKSGTTIIPYDGVGGAREFAALNRAVEKSRLQVPIGASYTLDKVAEAHRKVAGHVLGKVVLRIR